MTAAGRYAAFHGPPMMGCNSSGMEAPSVTSPAPAFQTRLALSTKYRSSSSNFVFPDASTGFGFNLSSPTKQFRHGGGSGNSAPRAPSMETTAAKAMKNIVRSIPSSRYDLHQDDDRTVRSHSAVQSPAGLTH